MRNVSFFAPETEKRQPKREAERLKLFAESLQKGGQPKGNEMVSGIVVKQSPLEHLARGLQTAAGGYFAGQSQNKAEEDERALQAKISEALSQWGSDPQGAASILAQDPRMSDMAMKLMMSETDYQRQKERQAQEDALKREMMQVRAAGGGNIPAAMQIANEMYEQERLMDPKRFEDPMYAAERKYNLIGQAAKTYGFDRGLVYGGGFNGYQPPQGQNHIDGIPPVDMMPNGEMQAPMGGQMPNGPLPPSGYPQDPVAAHAQAVAAQQRQIGVSPAQRPELSQPMQQPSIRPIQGYGDAAAQIAAQKKMAEGRASEIGKRQGENETLYRSMVSRMPQLEDTAERLSKLGQAATYTNAGQVRDFALRELGMEVPDAATARREYISMVDNEILPLLRDTFGAQFTQKEGESLKATLGSPNASPKEKDAVLRSFIRTKTESLGSARRELDYGQSIPEYTPRPVNIGGQSYNPTGQQTPQRDQIIQTLRGTGATQDEIDAYLQARGL